MAVIPFGLRAQIKIDSNGRVGLHTSSTSVGTDVLVNGNMKFINPYGTVLSIGSDYSHPLLTPGTATYGRVGTQSKPFSEAWAYHMHGYILYTEYTTVHASDQRLKENFRGIDNPMEKILLMNGRKYDYIPDKFDTIGTESEKKKRSAIKKDKLGFVAQELKEALPEAVVYEEEQDRYYVDYNAVIPVLVEAMKEQQNTIEELTARIEKLEGNAVKEKSASLDETTKASLAQNIPNPFNTTTTINMFLPETISSAKLYIYNMQGGQVKSFDIISRGNTSATIEGYTLDAGIYLYTLIANGKEVDTKKMILTK
jgi:hypothetical protein